MTDELQNLNTDFKELFTDNKLEELSVLLSSTPNESLFTITNYNYDIIKNYLDKENYNILKQYIRFVAFSSYLCEYAAANGILEAAAFQSMTESFGRILTFIQQEKE